jgi:hypothetical protein
MSTSTRSTRSRTYGKDGKIENAKKNVEAMSNDESESQMKKSSQVEAPISFMS